MNENDKHYLLNIIMNEILQVEELKNDDTTKQPVLDALDRIISEVEDVL